jgi:hypothetical protein
MNISTCYYICLHIALKAGTNHTPFQLVCRVHALMLIEYLLPMTNFTMSKDFAMTRVLNTQLLELEKLKES